METEEAIGVYEGERCNRDGCQGSMFYLPVENCSCHLHPPCRACTDNITKCNVCEEYAGDC